MKRCKHKGHYYTFKTGSGGESFAIACHCQGCGEQLSLGKSNDRPAAVKLEMQAALRAGDSTRRMTNAQYSGFYGDDNYVGIHTGTDAWYAGWIAREALSVGTDGWTWDPSRPLAGQFEAWVARRPAATISALAADVGVNQYSTPLMASAEPTPGPDESADDTAEYEPGGEVCIADDSTECECAECQEDQESWERDQGWHGDDGGDNDPDPDDCEPADASTLAAIAHAPPRELTAEQASYQPPAEPSDDPAGGQQS